MQSVCFSPEGNCTDRIIETIRQAKEIILVQAYYFTSAQIAEALTYAFKRGVKILIVLDKSQSSAKYSSADFTAHMGIPTFIDSHHAIAHNKIIIVDSEIVITGSFNFTKKAEERNAENILIIKSKELADIYTKNWQTHRKHSEKYLGR